MPPTRINKNYTFLVHGWRMLDSEKLNFAQTSFKRLYWSGYQGRFGALNWPTGWFDKPAHLYDAAQLNYLVFNMENYGISEAVARRVGPQLTNWLQTTNLGQNVHVLAHSMGNVVVSEALRAANGVSIMASYTPSEAATVASAYDPNQGVMQHELPPLSFLPDWVATQCISGDPLNPVILSPEASWRCYNSDNNGSYDMPPDLYRSDYAVNNSGTWEIQHGPTTDAAMQTPVGTAYYAGINTAAGRIINFQNQDDAALYGWEINQMSKPDNVILNGTSWRYHNPKKDYLTCIASGSFSCSAPSADPTVTSQFTEGLLLPTELQWGKTIDSGTNTAEILAHIIPTRTKALGQSAINGIQGNPALGFTDSNQDHSAQFHGYYAEPSPIRGNSASVRAAYWNRVLRQSLGFLENGNDFSGLKNDLIVIAE